MLAKCPVCFLGGFRLIIWNTRSYSARFGFNGRSHYRLDSVVVSLHSIGRKTIVANQSESFMEVLKNMAKAAKGEMRVSELDIRLPKMN